MPPDLHQRALALYEDDELAQHVTDHAIEVGTADKIQSGELRLPDKVDARKWLDTKLGRGPNYAEQSQTAGRISALEQLVKELQQNQQSPETQRNAILERRIAELEAKGGH